MRWMIGTAMMTAALLPAPALAQAVRQSAPQPAATQLPSVRALVDTYVAEKRTPGIAVAVGHDDAAPLLLAKGRIGTGANAAAATPDTLWRVYSMTKPITGIAAMILVEEGKLKLDQPISDFFPAYKSMKVLTDPDNSLASRPAAREITVRHLLTHTAGLGYNIITKGPLLKEYERLGIVPAALNRQTEAQGKAVRPKSLKEFAERTATLPLIADPGTKWSYSIGLDVMAAVVEAAAKMPFERFVQTRIFDPLGMKSSYWQVPASAAARLADNNAWVGDNLVPLDPGATSVFLDAPSFPYGGAGLVMSVRDYDRFLDMLQHYGTAGGVRILKPETARLAMSNLLPTGVSYTRIDAATGGSAGPNTGFGAGGSVLLQDVPGGPGAGTYGWGGAAGTIAFVDPKKRVRAAGMVNYFPAEKWPLRSDIIKALYSDLKR
ncbi:serine hydrolase domain-containing protein [Sphingomonas sp. Y38-1Y]|uniref:serine hydrolase domain-containing protein n=1 Tax=Sphingomonas sp. Y38-1Y TaxID=3078265 RepID=UPI0028F0A43E|nr:serine hydrolase domain-containing protein [Sphingomonas sp. Y38-1Y]